MNLLSDSLRPSTIVAHLDRYVIGQEDAKRALAVAVYAHYRKIAQANTNGVENTKSNLLLVGPTGTGKTLMCETLALLLGVPFVTADATSLAQTQYVGDEIEAIMQRLLDRAQGDLERTRHGIVFIDEIDKLKAPAGERRAASGESVQQALLKIMEGSAVRLRSGQWLDTTNILFICGGAFVGLERIMTSRHVFGYMPTAADNDRNVLARLNARVKPGDLIEFGLIPEFTGRLAIVARFQDLDRALMMRIMIEPRNCIYRQFQQLFRNEGVELVVAPRAFEEIADLAIEYKTGARSLRGLFEEMIAPVLFEIPDRKDVERVEIDSLFTQPRYTLRAQNT